MNLFLEPIPLKYSTIPTHALPSASYKTSYVENNIRTIKSPLKPCISQPYKPLTKISTWWTHPQDRHTMLNPRKTNLTIALQTPHTDPPPPYFLFSLPPSNFCCTSHSTFPPTFPVDAMPKTSKAKRWWSSEKKTKKHTCKVD